MWDVVVLVAMLYTALWVPIEVTILDWSEDYKEALDARWVVNRVFDVAFMVDIGVNCLTAYWDVKKMVWRRSHYLIFCHYARGWLLVDLISTVPSLVEAMLIFTPQYQSGETSAWEIAPEEARHGGVAEAHPETRSRCSGGTSRRGGAQHRSLRGGGRHERARGGLLARERREARAGGRGRASPTAAPYFDAASEVAFEGGGEGPAATAQGDARLPPRRLRRRGFGSRVVSSASPPRRT